MLETTESINPQSDGGEHLSSSYNSQNQICMTWLDLLNLKTHSYKGKMIRSDYI